MGARSRPASRRRDRSLHRSDVPAHPVHRRPRATGAALRRFAPRPVHPSRTAGEPGGEPRRALGPSLRARARGVRPCSGKRGAPPPGCRRELRLPLRGRPVLGSARARPRPGRDRRRACAQGVRRLPEARREDGDHDRSAHDEHAAQRVSRARTRLRPASPELSGSARRPELRGAEDAQRRGRSPRLLRLRPLRERRRRAAGAARADRHRDQGAGAHAAGAPGAAADPSSRSTPRRRWRTRRRGWRSYGRSRRRA